MRHAGSSSLRKVGLKKFEDVPERALTLTIPTLLKVPKLIVSVPGRRKAQSVRRTLEEPISTACPATILRAHPDVTHLFGPGVRVRIEAPDWSGESIVWTLAFQISYAIMWLLGGIFLDAVGTRLGLALAVSFWSVVNIFTGFASSVSGFAAFRFLLGMGEGLNWPGASKTVAEWFPSQERSVAVAIFDSGSSVGGAWPPWSFHG
jgi:MFS family permease